MRSATLAWVLLACVATQASAQEWISHGRFKRVTLYRPQGEVKEFVLLLSGDGGWDADGAGMALALIEEGAMVAGISVPQLLADLEVDDDDCVFPDGDLENLSHYLQGYAKLPAYYTPLLVGYASGATLAYAMLTQAPAGTFAGALSLDFCPDLKLNKPLCRGTDLRFIRRKVAGVDLLPSKQLPAPWLVLHGIDNQRCDVTVAQAFAAAIPTAKLVLLPNVGHRYAAIGHLLPQFLDAYHSLAAKRAAAPAAPAGLNDLPLVEVPADGRSDTFAVLLSGDGGWAGLDQEVAAALAAKGVPVVGLDSLRYFWSARTPQGLADDLDRVLSYYRAQWKKSRALLIGYSQGADVLPFALNRLSASSKDLVTQIILMGLGEKASFEFHLGHWFDDDDGGEPILPEAQKLTAAKALCLFGRDEEESLCPKIPAANVHALALPGGHHFDGAYNKLAELIIKRTKLP